MVVPPQQHHISNNDKPPSMIRAFVCAVPTGATITLTRFAPFAMKIVERLGMNFVIVLFSILMGLLIKGASPNDNRSILALYYTSRFVLVLSVCMMFAFLISTIKVAMRFAHCWIQNRQSAFPEAYTLLSERLTSKRAIRKTKYDVFLPPPTTTRTCRHGLVFLPGALVDHTAYAPIAASLSDRGMLVVVMNLEPMRLAFSYMGAGQKDVLAIIRGVSETVPVTEWSIGGHSMGGYQGAQLMVERGFPMVSKLVIWGQNGFMPDINLQERNVNHVSVLVVQASEDGFLAKSKQEIEAFHASLPLPLDGQASGAAQNNRPYTVYEMIDGGNHSGFGHYGPQLWPKPDGKRTISLEDQQKQCVEATANFLLT